jgi:hypothetical protein
LDEFEDLAIYDPESLADLLDDIISGSDPANVKQLGGGRTGYIDPETGTIIVVNPSDPDGGTAFRPEYGDPPRDPQQVFDNLQ